MSDQRKKVSAAEPEEEAKRPSHERISEGPVIRPDAPFRTMYGSGHEAGVAPGMASRSNGMPSTELHGGRKSDPNYGGAGVFGEHKDQAERHAGKRR
jgi:hypothetical protein